MRAAELLSETPTPYNEDRYKVKISALGGMDKPLNIFLFQEIRVLSFVVNKVRTELVQLQLAIDGEVVMTDEYATIIDELFNAKVPRTWMYDATNNDAGTKAGETTRYPKFRLFKANRKDDEEYVEFKGEEGVKPTVSTLQNFVKEHVLILDDKMKVDL